MNDETGKPSEVIGSAHMDADGTIVMFLRAEGPDGLVGHTEIVISPKDERYQSTIDHLGAMIPGQHVAVKPWS